MKLQVNGSEMEFPSAAGTLNDLLCNLGLCDKRVAVEHNHRIVPKEAFDTTGVKEGDVIEILSFVGGG